MDLKESHSQLLGIVYKCQVNLVNWECCVDALWLYWFLCLLFNQSLREMLKFPIMVDFSVLPFSSVSSCLRLVWSSGIRYTHICGGKRFFCFFFLVYLINWPFYHCDMSFILVIFLFLSPFYPQTFVCICVCVLIYSHYTLFMLTFYMV